MAANLQTGNQSWRKQTTVNAADNMETALNELSVPETGEEMKNVFEKNMRVVTDNVVTDAVINEYMPGFKPVEQQGFLNNGNYRKILADDSSWRMGETLDFLIDLGNQEPNKPSRGFNPCLTTLVLKGKFVEPDGVTAIPATVAPCNMWEIRQFEKTDSKNLNGLSYTPAERDLPGQNLKEEAYLIPKNNWDKIPIEFDRDVITIANRPPFGGTVTNTSLNKRVAKNDRWINERYYHIPMRLLDPAFERNCLQFDGTKVKLKRYKDGRKYMETTAAKTAVTDDRTNQVGYFLITEQPFLLLKMQEMQTNPQNIFASSFGSTQSYRYGTTKNFTIQQHQLTPGNTNHTFSFMGQEAQYDFLKLYAIPSEALSHQFAYSSFDVELASTNIKQIELTGLTYSKNQTNTTYNLNDQVEDKIELYRSWVGYIANTPTDAPADQLLGYAPFENFPSMEQYFEQGHPLVIDLRESRGYTGEDEPINRKHSNLSVKITLKAPIAAGQTVELLLVGVDKNDYVREASAQGTMVTLKQRTLINKQIPTSGTGETLESRNQPDPIYG